MVVTDPPDPLADLTRSLAGHDRVFSTGTLIDSLRFRVHLADRLQVQPRDVQAMVVGEHGTSEVLLWSSASVSGIPVLELLGQRGHPVEQLKQGVEHDIRYANITIIEGTGTSQYGIGAVSARLAEAVLRGGGGRCCRWPPTRHATRSPCRWSACSVPVACSRCTSPP
jgi:L-lactate dehydrogenase